MPQPPTPGPRDQHQRRARRDSAASTTASACSPPLATVTMYLASRCRRPFALEHTGFDRRPQPQRVVDVLLGSDDTCADPRHGPLRCDGQFRRAKRRPDTRWPADLYEAGIELYAQSRLGRRRSLRQHGLPKPGEGVPTRCAIPPRIERTRKDDHAISTSHAERDRIPALPHCHERSGCSRQVRDQDLGRSNRRVHRQRRDPLVARSRVLRMSHRQAAWYSRRLDVSLR